MTAYPKIRLFLDVPLSEGQSLSFEKKQSHYLSYVMRQKTGARIAVFNGRNGEWIAEITNIGKRIIDAVCLTQIKLQKNPPDVWMLFAPIKKTRTDFIVEKVTELGAARICPVKTEYTQSARIQQDRLQAHAVEAAEQCGGTYVPSVEILQPLDRVLANWPTDRNLLFCDETLAGTPILLNGAKDKKWAILIGPEGGFSKTELKRIRALDQTHPINLGPRILRADTAAVAALTLWQNALGDWR